MTKQPFETEADKQFLRDFGTPYKNHPQGDLTIIGGLEQFSKFDGTYPSLGNPNPLPEISKCCNTAPNIKSYVSGRLSCIPRNAVYIECPVCARQSFKIWLPIENKSRTPSEVQIRYWNSGKT